MTSSTAPARAWARRTLLLATLCVVTVGCSDALMPIQDPAVELQENLARWRANRPAEYRYTLQVNCYCQAAEYSDGVIVQVRAGGIVLSRADGGHVDPAPFARYDTVDELFALLIDAVDRDADMISATYHGRLGYPVEAAVDHRREVADDEIVFSVADLEPIS